MRKKGCNSIDILAGLNPSLNHRPIWRLPKRVLNPCLNFHPNSSLKFQKSIELHPCSTVCWINGRAGMALFFSVPVGAVVLENAVFFAVTAFNICAPQGDANVGNIYKPLETSAKFLCRVEAT